MGSLTAAVLDARHDLAIPLTRAVDTNLAMIISPQRWIGRNLVTANWLARVRTALGPNRNCGRSRPVEAAAASGEAAKRSWDWDGWTVDGGDVERSRPAAPI